MTMCNSIADVLERILSAPHYYILCLSVWQALRWCKLDRQALALLLFSAQD